MTGSETTPVKEVTSGASTTARVPEMAPGAVTEPVKLESRREFGVGRDRRCEPCRPDRLAFYNPELVKPRRAANIVKLA